jgi:AAA domain-containing protein
MNSTKYTDLIHEENGDLMTALVDTLWPAGESGIISGPPEVGKTWYAFAEAIGLALGVPVLGAFAVPRRKRVLFYEEEAGAAANRRRVHAVLRAYGASDRLQELADWMTVVSFHGLQLCDPEQIEELGRVIQDTRAEVVYLDSFFRMMPGQDLQGSKASTLALRNLDELARRHGVVFRVVHHDTKAGDSLYGTQALMAWRRDGLQITQDKKIRYQGNNAGQLVLGQMRLEFEDGVLTAVGCTGVESAETRVAEALQDAPESVEAIADRAGVSVSSAGHLLPKLAASGRAAFVVAGPAAGGGRPGRRYRRLVAA